MMLLKNTNKLKNKMQNVHLFFLESALGRKSLNWIKYLLIDLEV